ncbi:MAG: RHS repeat-associated core domain-containing protein [Candidatus Izemoplasmatales bacterium]
MNGVTQDTYEIRYLIDSDGSILGFVYEDATYYYLKDLQGNVIGVIDEAGNELVQYEYDAYGNVISNPDDPNGNIFEINPYTYRGYRYDSEIGMYYLNSRYYSPALSRFLNADGLLGELGDIASVNMYNYCANNPVMNVDPTGYSVVSFIGFTIVIGAIGGASVTVAWVIDSYGNQGILITASYGFYLPGISFSWAPFFSWRRTIYDLPGISMVVGGTTASPLTFGIEFFSDNKGVAGISLSIGVGIPSVEIHLGSAVTVLIPFSKQKLIEKVQIVELLKRIGEMLRGQARR